MPRNTFRYRLILRKKLRRFWTCDCSRRRINEQSKLYNHGRLCASFFAPGRDPAASVETGTGSTLGQWELLTNDRQRLTAEPAYAIPTCRFAVLADDRLYRLCSDRCADSGSAGAPCSVLRQRDLDGSGLCLLAPLDGIGKWPVRQADRPLRAPYDNPGVSALFACGHPARRTHHDPCRTRHLVNPRGGTAFPLENGHGIGFRHRIILPDIGGALWHLLGTVSTERRPGARGTTPADLHGRGPRGCPWGAHLLLPVPSPYRHLYRSSRDIHRRPCAFLVDTPFGASVAGGPRLSRGASGRFVARPLLHHLCALSRANGSSSAVGRRPCGSSGYTVSQHNRASQGPAGFRFHQRPVAVLLPRYPQRRTCGPSSTSAAPETEGHSAAGRRDRRSHSGDPEAPRDCGHRLCGTRS